MVPCTQVRQLKVAQGHLTPGLRRHVRVHTRTPPPTIKNKHISLKLYSQ